MFQHSKKTRIRLRIYTWKPNCHFIHVPIYEYIYSMITLKVLNSIVRIIYNAWKNDLVTVLWQRRFYSYNSPDTVVKKREQSDRMIPISLALLKGTPSSKTSK